MADVFARTTLGFGGAFTADQGLLAPGGTYGLNGVLLQNIGLNYSQNISRIYEIGTVGTVPNVYYVGGRSSGTMQLGHVVGPNVSIAAFYACYSNICLAANNDIKLDLTNAVCNAGASTGTATSSTATSLAYTAKYCVLIQIGVSTNSNDLIINENSQVMFSNLQFSATGAGNSVPGTCLPSAGVGGFTTAATGGNQIA